MLLNEFPKEHRNVQEQQAAIEYLKNEFKWKFAQQEKEIEALTASGWKVSERLQPSASAPQIAANEH